MSSNHFNPLILTLPPLAAVLFLLLGDRILSGLAAAAWLALASRALSRAGLNPSAASPCRGRWEGELVVVTGGSGGIGGEVVRRLEGLGAGVVVLDVVAPEELGDRSIFIHTDVTSPNSIQAARSETLSRLSRPPTALIATAGTLPSGGTPLLTTSESDVRKTLDVNLLGVIFCAQAFMPSMMEARRGHVLVTSSVAGFSPAAGVVAYAASKAALTAVVEGLQTEMKHLWGNVGVKISAVFPAAVRTRMFEGMELPVPEALMPMLEAGEVADRMIQILADGESEMVMMPALAVTSWWIPAMPRWVRVLIQDAGARGTARLVEGARRRVEGKGVVVK
ncbi:hypothetical protein CDD80_2643 [Ophiocordyceps camponoti-rufipedis]|uniref:Ketoreductase domain-containing protein n=1 Tax=Ophiocordyceps camponoti-rufipedis TaxID=2004952 RepID=A0A2C5Z5V9_9HYPO|nr:hypothetical protein CDD80_2643 [Ophiocordyceps camponoti-rufipedis]